MEATLPSNWKSLTIKKYDGTSDPNEHLDIYVTQVNLYTTNDVVLYRVSQHHWKDRPCTGSPWSFKKITMNIWNLDPAVFMHHLIMILRLRPFVNNLCNKPIFDMDKFRRKVAK